MSVAGGVCEKISVFFLTLLIYQNNYSFYLHPRQSHFLHIKYPVSHDFLCSYNCCLYKFILKDILSYDENRYGK